MRNLIGEGFLRDHLCTTNFANLTTITTTRCPIIAFATAAATTATIVATVGPTNNLQSVGFLVHSVRPKAAACEVKTLEERHRAENIDPRPTEVVALGLGKRHKLADSTDVLGAHLTEVAQQGELVQRCNERAPLSLHVKHSSHMDPVAEPQQAQLCYPLVVAPLQQDRQCHHCRRPNTLKDWSHVLNAPPSEVPCRGLVCAPTFKLPERRCHPGCCLRSELLLALVRVKCPP